MRVRHDRTNILSRVAIPLGPGRRQRRTGYIVAYVNLDKLIILVLLGNCCGTKVLL